MSDLDVVAGVVVDGTVERNGRVAVAGQRARAAERRRIQVSTIVPVCRVRHERAGGVTEAPVAQRRIRVERGIEIDRVAARGRRRARQYRIECRLAALADRDARVDVAELVFETPVAAERRGAGVVVAGRDVGVGQPRQRADERAAVGAGRQVAAVDQDVAVRAECIAPALDRGRARHQFVVIDDGIAEEHAAVAAVRDDVQCAEVGAIREQFADLFDAVPIGIEHRDFEDSTVTCLRQQIREQHVGVRRRRIDDD